MPPLNTLRRCATLGREPPLDLLGSLAVVPATNMLENNELRSESQHEHARDYLRPTPRRVGMKVACLTKYDNVTLVRRKNQHNPGQVYLFRACEARIVKCIVWRSTLARQRLLGS